MGIIIILSNKNEPHWAGPGFLSLAHIMFKRSLSNPAYIFLSSPALIHPINTLLPTHELYHRQLYTVLIDIIS